MFWERNDKLTKQYDIRDKLKNKNNQQNKYITQTEINKTGSNIKKEDKNKS